MKPQQQGFILNRNSGTSRECESASDWELWEQMITQASQQNKQQRQRYITTEERTLLDRQSSVIRAQYDIAKHELLSNSSISVVQNIDIKLQNDRKHRSDKLKRIKGHLRPSHASGKRTKVGSNMLNECCSYCNLTTAHIDQLNKGQRHRLGVAHNLLERTGCVELSSRSSAISRNKVEKRKHGRAERLKAKPVRSDTMTTSLSNELQTVMIKLRPENPRLMKDSTITDKTLFKSKRIVKKYQQNVEHMKFPIKQDNSEYAIKCLVPAPHAPLPEKELNDSRYDSWYHFRQTHHEGNKLILLEESRQQKTGSPSEQSSSFYQLQIVSKPPDKTRKYEETMQKPRRRKGKPRYSERRERTEARRRLELNHAKSVDSAENSTLKEEYSNYSRNNFLGQAAEIKSSLALNVECNKNNNIWPWEESQPQTHGVSEANRENLAKEICKEGHALKRCSREIKLYSGQSETESMIMNVLNPTNQSADSELLSSLFESSDLAVRRHQRKKAAVKSDSNNFTSLSVLRAMCKEAHTCLNIKEEEYVSASSNLLMKPAVANLHEVCEKFEDENEMLRLRLEVTSSKSFNSQEAAYLFDRSTKANNKIVQNRLSIKDSWFTMKNFCREQRNNVFTNKMSISVINISSVSLLRSQPLTKLPRLDATINADIKTSSNLFNLKNTSAVSFLLSSVTTMNNIHPTLYRPNRIIIPASTDFSEYLETPKQQLAPDSVLKSSSKISLFQSDSISNFLMTRQKKVLTNRNSFDSACKISPCYKARARANNSSVSLESQIAKNFEIVQSQEKYEIPTLRKSPGKNALDKQATRSQFSQSFCTMNLRIRTKDFTTANHTKNINNYVEDEPRLSVLYQKDISTRPKNKIKADSQMKNVPRVIRRSASKELSRVIKPIQSQKHMASNLKKVKFQKNDRVRLPKYTTLEKALVSKSLKVRQGQESQPKLLKTHGLKSPAKPHPNHVPVLSHEVTQIGTNLSFNTNFFKESWPTSCPITSGSKARNDSQSKDSSFNDENYVIVSKKLQHSHENIDEGNEDRFPAKTGYITSQNLLSDHKSKIKNNHRLLKLNSETGASRSWKSIINKCVKTIKSVTTKKNSIGVNTNMSAAQCCSKLKQWEQSCYFCTISQDTPKINKLNTTTKRLSNVDGYTEYRNDENFLKRCSGTLNFHKSRKVQDIPKINKSYTQKLNDKISQEFIGQARLIYQNPATYIYRTCDNYSKQNRKKYRTTGTKTNESNMSTVSTITSQPLYKSKSTQSLAILKHENKVPRNPKSYKIETIYPLTCDKFSRSKSEIILPSSNVHHGENDNSNIQNTFQGFQPCSVSNKSPVSRKKKEKLFESKGSLHFVKSSLTCSTNFKRFLFRCTTLLKRNHEKESKAKAIKFKSQAHEPDNKCLLKAARSSYKSPELRLRHLKVRKDDLKKSKSDRRHDESNCSLNFEKYEILKIAKECGRNKLGKRRFQGSAESKKNTARYQSGDAESLVSKMSNKKQGKDFSYLNNFHRQDKLRCVYAEIKPNKVVKKNRARSLRESLHKNLELPRFHYLSDKIQSQKSMNFKKTNCQVVKKDVGTNCIRKKRFKHKTKCVQAELWDEKTVYMMSGDRKSDCMPQYRTSDRTIQIPGRNKRDTIGRKQNTCGQMTFGVKKIETDDPFSRKNKDDFKKELKKKCVAKVSNDKNEAKITHNMVSKCKNFLKINKAQVKQPCDEEHCCYRYVNCNINCDKFQSKKIKNLEVDNARNFKCTQTLIKVKKAKSTKPITLARTAVKALQVDSKKLLKDGKINQAKFVKPKEFMTLPFKSNEKKNEATVCEKVKQKNKYIKTEEVGPISSHKITNTDNHTKRKLTVKQTPAKKTAKDKKNMSSVNRQNDISTYINNSMKPKIMRFMKPKHQKNTLCAIEALLIHEPPITSDTNAHPQCAALNTTKKIESRAKQKKDKTRVKAKKEKSSPQKPTKVRVKDVLTVSTTNPSKKLAATTLAKKKQKQNNAKTKTALSLNNKSVMTQDILVSSCCTNTTPIINKRTKTKVPAKHKLQRIAAKGGKKASPSNKAVATKGIDVSSRSTNTTLSRHKRVEAKIYVKKKRGKSEERRALSCPSRSTYTTFIRDRKVKAKIYTKKKGEKNEERRASSCPRPTIAKVKRTGISFKVKKVKTCGCQKQPKSDCSVDKSGEPFIESSHTKNKRRVNQVNATQEVRIPRKVKTKIYTTEDKQTSASSRCILPLKSPSKEAPVKYPTMMSANKTKQVCCALFTAGAWHNSKATISRSNQVSASTCKPLIKNLQIMTTHGVTCNMEKQRHSRKCKYVNAVAKENVKQLKRESNVPLSKSSPCCICGNTICEECKVKIINKSTKKGNKDKKPNKILTKDEKETKEMNDFTRPTTKQNVSLKVVGKSTMEKILRKNKCKEKEEKEIEKLNTRKSTRTAKEAKELEKIHKQKSTCSAKEAKKLEKINKQKHKRAAKEAREIEKLNNRKNKHLAKEAKKLEKLNKEKDKSIPKEERKVQNVNEKKNSNVRKEKNKAEILNKRKNKSIRKEEKKLRKLNKGKNKNIRKEEKKLKKLNKGKNNIKPKEEKKKGKTLRMHYQSMTKVRSTSRNSKEPTRMKSDVQKQAARTKRPVKDERVKTIRIPFPWFNRLRIQKKNQRDVECQHLYEKTFRRRMVLFMYVRSCGYIVRTMLRRLLGCLFFALGVIVWTPCICCFECCRECLFCCCK